MAANAGNWRAQFMGDVDDEFAAALLGALGLGVFLRGDGAGLGQLQGGVTHAQQEPGKLAPGIGDGVEDVQRGEQGYDAHQRQEGEEGHGPRLDLAVDLDEELVGVVAANGVVDGGVDEIGEPAEYERDGGREQADHQREGDGAKGKLQKEIDQAGPGDRRTQPSGELPGQGRADQAWVFDKWDRDMEPVADKIALDAGETLPHDDGQQQDGDADPDDESADPNR